MRSLFFLLLLLLPLASAANPAPAESPATFEFKVGETPMTYPIEPGYFRLSVVSPSTFDFHSKSTNPSNRLIEVLMLDSDIKQQVLGNIAKGVFFQIQGMKSLENLDYSAQDWHDYQKTLTDQLGKLDMKSLLKEELKDMNKRRKEVNGLSSNIAMKAAGKPQVYANDDNSTRFVMLADLNSPSLTDPAKLAIAVATVYARHKIVMISAAARILSDADLTEVARRLDEATASFVAVNSAAAPSMAQLIAQMTVPELARACADAGKDANEVLAACTKLLEHDQNSVEVMVEAHYRASEALYQLGEPDKAMAEADKSVALNPDFADARAFRGILLGMRGQMGAAREDFLKAIELNPKDTRTIGNIGLTYAKQDDFSHAIPYYERVLALDPDSAFALAGRCWALAASGKSLDKALLDCNRALTLTPKDYDAINSRGVVQYRLGHYQQAIDDFDGAIAGDPTVASSYFVRGLAKRALGKTADGDADIVHGRELEPGIEKRYAGYGMTLESH